MHMQNYKDGEVQKKKKKKEQHHFAIVKKYSLNIGFITISQTSKEAKLICAEVYKLSTAFMWMAQRQMDSTDMHSFVTKFHEL